MTSRSRPNIDELEAALALDPLSERIRESLLEAYMKPDGLSSARRFEHIRWFIRNKPSHFYCRLFLTAVEHTESPEAYDDLKGEWLARVDAAPTDPLVLRGAAAFFRRPERLVASALVRRAITVAPEVADAHIDLALSTDVYDEALESLEKARQLGSEHPNLAVLLAQAAVKASAFSKAEAFALELLEFADRVAKEHSAAIEWPHEGADFWTRARAASRNDTEARALVTAVGEYAHRKHYGHTVLGLLACRCGDTDLGVTHLRRSGELWPEHRLGAYGPSLLLVREVCEHGLWSEAEDFFRAWLLRSDTTYVRRWLMQVEQRQLPEEPSAG